MRTVTSRKLTECLDDIFTTHGLPVSLKTDNAQCFVSQEFTEFLQSRAIFHKTSIPLWPQSNGEVERQNRTLLKFLRITHAKGRDMKSELNRLLFAYRVTPHCTTGQSPSELLYKRKIRGTLPEFVTSEKPSSSTSASTSIRAQDKTNKEKKAKYGDKRRMAQPSDIREEDLVLMQQRRQHKLDTTFKPQLYMVISRKGSEVTIESPDGVQCRRNVAHLRKYVSPTQDASDTYSDVDNTDFGESSQLPMVPAEESGDVDAPRENEVLPSQPEVDDLPLDSGTVPLQQQQDSHQPRVTLRHSTRVRQQPRCLRDYISSM